MCMCGLVVATGLIVDLFGRLVLHDFGLCVYFALRVLKVGLDPWLGVGY